MHNPKLPNIYIPNFKLEDSCWRCLLHNICAVGSKWYEFKLENFSLQDKSVSR